MKKDTSNSKVETVVANGIDLEVLGKTLEKKGAETGKSLEAAHEKGASGLTTTTLEVMRELHAMRDTIQLEGSLRVYWDALYASAPNYCKEVSRAKQTKSDTLKVMRAWDKGAKFAFAGLTVMTKHAGAFLTAPKPGEAAPGAKTQPEATNIANAAMIAAKAAEVSPKASNTKTAMAFLRQQTAMLQAFAEKNKNLLPDAARNAIGELTEALKAIPED